MLVHLGRMQTHTAGFQAGWGAEADGLGGDLAGAGPNRMTPRPLFTADEVAAVLGVPRTYVYALARRGELPTVRVGERYVRFRAQALERWIAEHESTRPRGTL